MKVWAFKGGHVLVMPEERGVSRAWSPGKKRCWGRGEATTLPYLGSLLGWKGSWCPDPELVRKRHRVMQTFFRSGRQGVGAGGQGSGKEVSGMVSPLPPQGAPG